MSAKKKPSASKRPAAKPAAKTASAAKAKSAPASANSWAQQSAKLYQLPFAQADASQAAKQATDTVRSATEQFMKFGNDMMQQLFSGAKQPQFAAFDPKASEKAFAYSRESADQLAKSANTANRAMSEAAELTRENAEAIVEVGNIAVNVSKQVSAELINYANSTFSQNVELSKQALNCRTLNDMFDLSSKIMKSNVDAAFNESIKVSELLFQCATDISEPLNERISESTERLTKVVAA
jgi:hypothetical protein